MSNTLKFINALTTRFLVVLILLSLCSHVSAQQPFDFFWSTKDLGSGNIVNDDLVVNMLEGETQTLNFFYTTDGPAQSELGVGGGLDIETSNSGVIEFNSGETFDFDIVTEVFGRLVPIGERWASSDGSGFVGPADVFSDLIDRFDFFTVSGSGISTQNTGPDFFDNGYDADANAFFIGTITFTALNNGTVEITTSVDDLTSLTNDGFVPLLTEFAVVTINVVEPFVVDGDTLTITGTDSDDVIDVSAAGGVVTVLLNGQMEQFMGIDELVVDARNGDDQVTTDVNFPVNIDGGCGDDILIGGTGPDVINGGPGIDEIEGRSGADTLDGGSDNNMISGGSGADLILGGSAVDTVFGGTGADTIFTFEGDDVVTAGGGNDEIDSGDGADTIAGGTGNDIINAGEGNDIITGGNGQDTINGGVGDDEISSGRSADTVQGGSGNDIIFGNDGLDILNGGAGDDEISGGRGSDTINGGSGDDILTGQSGNDTMNGNGGNDIFTGGAGNDLFDGGSGSDTAIDTGEQGEISIENS